MAQQPSYDISAQIDLIRSVVRLEFPWRVHYTVLPGTVAIYCNKGRLHDAEGRPNLYPAGTTISYALFAAPPWSDAEQYAIVVSLAVQRVKVTLRCPLPEMETEPATVSAVIRFEVTDPLKLVERTPGWEEPGALMRINEQVTHEIRDAVEGIVRRLAIGPEWLTPQGVGQLAERIVSGLDLSPRGLTVLGESSPQAIVQYPASLVEAVYDLYTRYLIWQRDLSSTPEAEREELAASLALSDAELHAGIVAGSAPPLEYLVRERPDLLERLGREEGPQPAQALATLLQSPTSSGFYSRLIEGLLPQLSAPTPLARSAIEGAAQARSADLDLLRRRLHF